MNGRRVYELEPHEFEPGDYGQWQRDANNWYAKTPNGLLANLSAHTVDEHHDGSISVSPSILVNGGRSPTWHGFLKAGVWQSC